MAVTERRRVELTGETLVGMWERMVLIRAFEETTGRQFADGHIPGFVHLYAGEEAVAVGVCTHLSDADYITSTHRGHGHCIAKGVDVAGMAAELMGRQTGICKGKGGSMHVADVERGMLGANGIVGGGFPLACGAALTAKVHGTDAVTVCFFGDGAANQGTFHESVNLAAIWKLPVVFVCENNGYAEATTFAYHCSVSDIATRAQGYGIPGVIVDGLDALAMFAAAGEAIDRARRGDGPTLIEAKTYRFYGHEEGDAATYRTAEEVAAHRARDPLTTLAAYLTGNGIATEADIERMAAAATATVDAAYAAGAAAPWPDAAETLDDVYVSYGGR
jgi:TPP-dependent pyruvate/acetoin dehydrogenase alpha subunit